MGTYTDVYGWGKTGGFGICGKTELVKTDWDELSPPLAELLSECLAPDPRQRPKQFQDVLNRMPQPA